MAEKKQSSRRSLTEGEYQALAEFRYRIRKYLHHMERHARALGQNPQQYQVLLAIHGMPKDMIPTVSAVAERMQIAHNSMVCLVDRCEEKGLLERKRSGSDRRAVELVLTPEGRKTLHQLASAARAELRSVGPAMLRAILLISKASGKRVATLT